LVVELIDGKRGNGYGAIDDLLEILGICAIASEKRTCGSRHTVSCSLRSPKRKIRRANLSDRPGDPQALTSTLSAQKRQNRLWRRVGLSHCGQRRLLQHLRLGQVGGFRGHVGVADSRLSGREVRNLRLRQSDGV